MTSREEEEGKLGWLPDEIMWAILGKLVFPAYVARFSAVCKRWYRLVCDVWPEFVKEHPQIPVVLVPIPIDEEEDVCRCRIYNNLMGECALIELPFGTTRILGSSFGWLIVTDMNHSVSLFNPLSRSHIRLPPLPLPFIEHQRYRENYLVKAVLSHEPNNNGWCHFDIAITMNPDFGLGFNTATGIAFLHVDPMELEMEKSNWVYMFFVSHPILDINSIGGRIYFLCCGGFICCCQCSSSHFRYFFASRRRWQFRAKSMDHATAYLVESPSSSEPLVVFRYKKKKKNNSRVTVGFKVFALNVNEEEETHESETKSSRPRKRKRNWNWTEEDHNKAKMREQEPWTEIKSLDNDVLFLGDNASIYFRGGASNPTDLRPGCIYFTDEYDHHLFKSKDIRDEDRGGPTPTDMGVFNLQQNRLTHYNTSSDDVIKCSLVRPPIWVQPSYEILNFSRRLN